MGSLIASLETTLFTGNHLGSLLEVPKAKLSPSLMASKSLSSVASSINDLECGVVGDGLCGIEEDDWGMVSVGLGALSVVVQVIFCEWIKSFRLSKGFL